jgi:ATP-dependent Clp protease ATP-binding subunit ClpA
MADSASKGDSETRRGREVDLDSEAISARVDELLRSFDLSHQDLEKRGATDVIAHELPLLAMTPRTRATIKSAHVEARKLGHYHVGTEHLLLSIVADNEGIAGALLSELGVAEDIRAKLLELMRSPSYRTKSSEKYDGHQGGVVDQGDEHHE